MALTSLELTTAPFASGRTFGEVGAYELLTGRAHFAFDPTGAFNTVITDIDLTAREADGRVHCSADISILRPADVRRRNRRLLLDVVNRGNRGLPRSFDVHPADPAPGMLAVGDGWLMERGYIIVACGWQHDVRPAPGLLRIDVPPVLEGGQPLTGRIVCRYHVAAATRVLMLSDSGHVPYPAVDIDEPNATLTVRDHPLGAPRVIPRSEWEFALLNQGEPIPSAHNIYLGSAFEPGKFYEVTYTATGARPTGLGAAATRDLLSFLRYATAGDGNPCAGEVDHTLAFGSSQSGGFLRTMLRLGLCADEDGRPALDGMLPNIAGIFNTEVNWRFGQPSYYGPYSFSYTFPFADLDQREPHTGEVNGMQHIACAHDFLPKVIYTNSSAEYWYLYGALAHINLADGTDAALPPNVRIYQVGGTQHGGGTWPPTRERPGIAGPAAVHLINSVDFRPLLRAALVHLDRWVTEAIEPPPSRYPRVADGTLVSPDIVREHVARLPGVSLAPHLFEAPSLDYGTSELAWRATRVPPAIGPLYPTLVPAVDNDGNDLGGIRLPDLEVPVATHTGWNQRTALIGGTDHVGPTLAGSTIPFPRTRVERATTGDPRPSIEERYASREDYLVRVRAAAVALVSEGYLLASDVNTIVESSAVRWDTFAQ